VDTLMAGLATCRRSVPDGRVIDSWWIHLEVHHHAVFFLPMTTSRTPSTC